jgi:hypothetical protein
MMNQKPSACRGRWGFTPTNLEEAMKWGLLWLLGVPIPVLILLYFLF